MRLKVCVEEGESTPHKLQRALSSLGAGLEGNSGVFFTRDTSGSKRGERVDGERCTNNDKHHGKHVDKETHR